MNSNVFTADSEDDGDSMDIRLSTEENVDVDDGLDEDDELTDAFGNPPDEDLDDLDELEDELDQAFGTGDLGEDEDEDEEIGDESSEPLRKVSLPKIRIRSSAVELADGQGDTSGGLLPRRMRGNAANVSATEAASHKTASYGVQSYAELSSDEEYAPKQQDLSTMTKRQRAKYLDEQPEDLLELPTETKKRKLTQEEVALRRTEITRKREQQRKQKLEDTHRETIQKLLKKPSARKNKTNDEEDRQETQQVSNVEDSPKQLRYICDKSGSTLSIPVGINLPLMGEFKGYPEAVSGCAVSGCHQPRKYRDPHSLQPSCSLEHYRLIRSS